MMNLPLNLPSLYVQRTCRDARLQQLGGKVSAEEVQDLEGQLKRAVTTEVSAAEIVVLNGLRLRVRVPRPIGTPLEDLITCASGPCSPEMHSDASCCFTQVLPRGLFERSPCVSPPPPHPPSFDFSHWLLIDGILALQTRSHPQRRTTMRQAETRRARSAQAEERQRRTKARRSSLGCWGSCRGTQQPPWLSQSLFCSYGRFLACRVTQWLMPRNGSRRWGRHLSRGISGNSYF